MLLIEPYLIVPAGLPLTRASAATYLDGGGVLRYAAVNEARPIVEAVGSTNLVPDSNGFTRDLPGVDIDTPSGSTTDPDLTGVLHSIVEANWTSAVQQIFDGALTDLALPSGAYAASVFLRAVSSSHPEANARYFRVSAAPESGSATSVIVDVIAQTIVSSDAGATNARIEICTSGWMRVSFSFAPVVGQRYRVRVAFLDDTLSDTFEAPDYFSITYRVRAFGCQIEPGAASSYIPTTVGAVARAPDVLAAVPEVPTLLASNIPIDDHTAWSDVTAYVASNRVIVDGETDIWECVVGNTNVYPPSDTAGKWLHVGKVNRWRMFDGYMSTSTSYAEEINATLYPRSPADSLVLFGLSGASVRVTVTDDIEGLRYDRLIDIRSYTLDSTWHSYFFAPQGATQTLVLTDLPKTRRGSIAVQIAAPGGAATCGMCLVGRATSLGKTQWGASGGITDYSRKEADDFGNFNIVERAYADRANYSVFVTHADAPAVRKRLAARRAKASVFVGNAGYELTIAYGYAKSFDIVLPHPAFAEYNLEIEGLT